MTGATGFIGGTVARQLRDRGDDVVCLVRSPEKAGKLTEIGCELVSGDLGDRDAMRAGMQGCDGVIHAAAMYEVGIPKSQHPAMHEANVVGTENVLGAAKEAGIPKIVYVSTCGAFGNTHHEIVDETYEHPGKDFTSYYEETKVEAHKVAKRMIAEGLPCTIVQPGGVYGPGDTSQLADLLEQFLERENAADPLPRARHLPRPRRGHRGRDRPRPRQGRAGRDLRARRPADDDARRDRHPRRDLAAGRPPSTPYRPS